MADTTIISDIQSAMAAYARLAANGTDDGDRLTGFQLRRAEQVHRDLMTTAIDRFGELNS